MAVLSLLPYTDQPAVADGGDRAERRVGGATKPAQVCKPLRDLKWLLLFIVLSTSTHNLWFPNQVLNIKMELWIDGHLLCCSLFNASSLSVVISIIIIIHHSMYKCESVLFFKCDGQNLNGCQGWLPGFRASLFFPADVNSVAVCLAYVGVPKLSRRKLWSSWKT